MYSVKSDFKAPIKALSYWHNSALFVIKTTYNLIIDDCPLWKIW